MPWFRPLTLSVALVAAPALSLAGDLTTRDIVELSRSGLGDEVLVALVEVDGGPFDLSPADLLDLKAEGLSDRVLVALVRAGRHAAPYVAVFDEGLPDEAPPAYDETLSHSSMFGGDPYVTSTVVVPFPVYVPVFQQRTVPSRRGGHRTDDVPKRRGYRTDHDLQPRVSTPGVQRGVVTAESIGYAPPGFHPTPVRARRPAGPASAPAAAPAPNIPGIARSTEGADSPPPGVARSQRPKR